MGVGGECGSEGGGAGSVGVRVVEECGSEGGGAGRVWERWGWECGSGRESSTGRLVLGRVGSTVVVVVLGE